MESNKIEKEYSPEAFEKAEEAWEYTKGVTFMELSDITRIHRKLMRDLNPRIAGKWRDCPVIIGDRYCKFDSKQDIENQITAVLIEMRQSILDKDKIPLSKREELCKKNHIDFEMIHPHEDGNGRVGRILYNWHRMRMDLPIHVITEAGRFEYYEWFKAREREEALRRFSTGA